MNYATQRRFEPPPCPGTSAASGFCLDKANLRQDLRRAVCYMQRNTAWRHTKPATEPRFTPEELARIGSRVVERRMRPMLRPEDDGKFVALDVQTGDYEIDDDDYAAVSRLRPRNPAADAWLSRVGHPAAYRMRRDH